MCHLFNLLSATDSVTAQTGRKVKLSGCTGSVKSVNYRMMLTIDLQHCPTYDSETSTIRLSGTNATECQHVKLGAYHTHTIGLGDSVKVHKQFWDKVDFDRVTASIDDTRNAELGVILISQDGIANICAVSDTMTMFKKKISCKIPSKRSSSASSSSRSSSNAASAKFHRTVYDGFVKEFDFDIIKCVVIAGPAFASKDFFEFVKDEAKVRRGRSFLEAFHFFE